jgi:hypothetical protein
MDTLQQWFHIEPLLILYTINSGPGFQPESLPNFCFSRTLLPPRPLHHCRRHAGTSLTPPPPFQDSFAAVVPGLLQCPDHHSGTPPHSATKRALGAIRRPPAPSLATVHPRLHHHKLRTTASHLYVLPDTAVDLWASLLPPLTSCQTVPPWGALPNEVMFPPTLPRAARVLQPASHHWPSSPGES